MKMPAWWPWQRKPAADVTVRVGLEGRAEIMQDLQAISAALDGIDRQAGRVLLKLQAIQQYTQRRKKR